MCTSPSAVSACFVPRIGLFPSTDVVLFPYPGHFPRHPVGLFASPALPVIPLCWALICLPAAAQAGTRITFEEDSVCFQVAEAAHPRFERHGNDLAAVVQCSPFAFLLTGSSHEISTLDGRRLHVSIPPRTLRQRVPREGMPYTRTDASGGKAPGKGDLVVYLFANWATAVTNAKT